MSKRKGIMFICLVAGMVFFRFSACSQKERQEIGTKTHQVVAFVGVNVVPMDSDRILERQTVIVRDEKITEIGLASEAQVPQEALEVDGRGKYLMPGLADMHVHLGYETDLLLLVANGVTTVRNMSGRARHLQWRNQIAQGELSGPTIFTAGRIIDGPGLYNYFVVETAEEAEREVAEQKEAGFDFIKVYNYLSQEAYEGLTAAAKKHQMPVVGHVPIAVRMAGAFKEGQASNEHLRGYIFELVTPNAPIQPGLDLRSRNLAWNYVEESKFASLADATRKACLWNCPTIVVMQHSGLPAEEHARLLSLPEMRYLPLQNRRRQRDRSKISYLKNFSEADFEASKQAIEVRKIFVKALHDEGARLLLGTDTYVSGFALHEELRNFVDIGLSPYEAIKAGTSDAAEFLNAADIFGTVEVGKRADLILAEGNPLEDVANVARRAGVMLRGQWLPKKELQRMLDDLAASHVPTIHTAEVERPDEITHIATGSSPQLSPHGKVIYYLGQGLGQEEFFAVIPDRNKPPSIVRRVGLFAVSAKGGSSRKITDRVISNESGKFFDLSPDGRTIAYYGHVGEGPNPTPALMTVSTNGGKSNILLTFDKHEIIVPRWSPDGSLLAYTYGTGLYVISPEGGGEPKKLAHLAEWEGWTVRWSPEGKYIAALGYTKLQQEENAVSVVPASGGELRRLTPVDENKYKEGLEWHPDGQRLTYMYYGPDGIRQAYLDGSPTTLLIDQPDRWDYIGTWAPDGRRYYFMSWNENDELGLYVYDDRLGNIAPFYSPIRENLDLPVWSRDGKTMVWASSKKK